MDINETSLTRVWQHASSDRPFAILTAFRGEYTKAENIARNKTLAASIRNDGFGFCYLDGFWVENQGTDQEVHVSEDIMFVIGDEHTDSRFLNKMIQYGKKFDQDGVLVKPRNGTHIYDQHGDKIFTIGELKPNKAGEMYSRLRGSPDRTFVFESEHDDLGWFQRLAGINIQ